MTSKKSSWIIRHKRTIAKCIALFWTVIYTGLIAFICCTFLIVAYVVSCYIPPGPIGIFIALVPIAFLISLPISIVLMWKYYRSQQYTKLHIAWVIPLVLLCLLQTISLLRFMTISQGNLLRLMVF